MTHKSSLATIAVTFLLAGLGACGDRTPTPAPAAVAAVDGTGEQSAETPVAAGADAKEQPAAVRERPAPKKRQTDRAVGHHVLIGFGEQSLAPSRTRMEAEELADSILARMKAGEDLDELVTAWSDDPSKATDQGRRRVRNFGIDDVAADGDTPRSRLPAYGDVLFDLEVGGVGIARPERGRNDLGYFIIKRIE